MGCTACILFSPLFFLFLFLSDGNSNDGQIDRSAEASSRLEMGAKVLLMSQGEGRRQEGVEASVEMVTILVMDTCRQAALTPSRG